MKREQEELDIESPPYPGDEDTPAHLYERMRQLEAWLAYYRDSSNRHFQATERLPLPRPVPAAAVHHALPLRRQMVLVYQLRGLREAWDTAVRMLEDRWSSPRARAVRHGLLHHAAMILDCAYLSEEMLEARAETVQQRQLREWLGPLFNAIREHRGERDDERWRQDREEEDPPEPTDG